MRFAVCIDSLELVIFFTFFFFSEPKKKGSRFAAPHPGIAVP